MSALTNVTISHCAITLEKEQKETKQSEGHLEYVHGLHDVFFSLEF